MSTCLSVAANTFVSSTGIPVVSTTGCIGGVKDGVFPAPRLDGQGIAGTGQNVADLRSLEALCRPKFEPDS